jgi:outer membrane protein assembly factor BamD
MTACRELTRKAGRFGLLLAVVASVSGCASSGLFDGIWGEDSSTAAAATGDAIAPDLASAKQGEAVAALYNKGLDRLNSGEFKSAAKQFAEVERQFPYSSWATKAILMQSYAFYRRNEYDDAINASNRFITLHPGHKDAPYAT